MFLLVAKTWFHDAEKFRARDWSMLTKGLVSIGLGQLTEGLVNANQGTI